MVVYLLLLWSFPYHNEKAIKRIRILHKEYISKSRPNGFYARSYDLCRIHVLRMRIIIVIMALIGRIKVLRAHYMGGNRYPFRHFFLDFLNNAADHAYVDAVLRISGFALPFFRIENNLAIMGSRAELSMVRQCGIVQRKKYMKQVCRASNELIIRNLHHFRVTGGARRNKLVRWIRHDATHISWNNLHYPSDSLVHGLGQPEFSRAEIYDLHTF